MDPSPHQEPGGFIQPTLPSPAPSTATTSTSATTTATLLPRQRTHPLRPGSTKETSLINHIDKQILLINRRHARKFSREVMGEKEGDGGSGYEGFGEVVGDVEGVLDLVWVSGTPSLQIPYIISLAGLVNTYLPDFPFSPRPTFRLLRKLDNIFASLLRGEDVETGTTLPGFEGRRGVVSMTEKVRIKSLAERCRITVIEVREEGGGSMVEIEEEDEDEEDEDEDMGVGVGEGYEKAPGRWEMEAARVYEKTIQLLGDEMGSQGPI
ncbi:hypothetical protein FQN54_006844 [Arachnomyces sp. PD_36]|nr:hypothetical protein FQN54_006844 [Arachnomyces sp. PD_36]